MRPRVLRSTLLAAALLAAVPAAAHAGGTRSWEVCGGTSFQTCASVVVTVTPRPASQGGGAVVTMQIRNLSGSNNTYAGTVFTNVGLDNVIPSSINVITDMRSSSYLLSVTGPCMTGPNCDYSRYWSLTNDAQNGGGVRIDLNAGTTNGSRYSIASSCNNGLAPGHNLYFVTGCGPQQGGFVTLSFAVTGDFNPALTGDLFLKGQNGPNGQSTTCITTAGDKQNCYPTSTVPEPITAALFGTGLLAMGGVRRVMRRREERARADA